MTSRMQKRETNVPYYQLKLATANCNEECLLAAYMMNKTQPSKEQVRTIDPGDEPFVIREIFCFLVRKKGYLPA